MKRYILIFLIIFSICELTSAKQTLVSSAADINNGNWNVSDTLVMKNGTWNNQSISFSENGTATQPFVLKAETPGSVILTGASKIAFSGNYIEVSGLFFKNGNLSSSEIISFRTSSSSFANHSRVTNCAIMDCNPTDNTLDTKWVSLHGEQNRIDHCSFQNKTNSGTLMVVWLVAGIIPNHTIDQNYFGYRNSNLDATGAELNGQEIIRIGDSSTSMQTANVQVTNNFFEHCNGEIEVISNKSCGNYYSNNVFYECHGMLTLRHGNGCTVDGNFFFGNGISDTGGVRIIGENHKVYNNYFERLRGTGYRAALCIVRGKENSLANEYFQVKNALVAFNTFVDCTVTFNINYNSSTTCTLPPIGSTIAHNHIYNSSSSNTNVTIDQTNIGTMDLSWLNNLMNKGSYSNFSYNSTQIITGKDAKLAATATPISMMEPIAGSALELYSTTNYTEITSDIRGRSRLSVSKLPGASQIAGTTKKTMPQRTTVGAQFFLPTGNNELFKSSNLDIMKVINKNQLLLQPLEAGHLSIISMNGSISQFEASIEGETTIPIYSKGLSIARFVGQSGLLYIKKISIN